MTSTPQTGIIAGINVTPLVDITLVLLIIFIVTARIIVIPAVRVDLPRATQTEGLQVVFSVVMPRSGPTLVDGTPTTSDENVVDLAKDALLRNADVRAVINADGAVPYRRVVHLLDLVKGAGIARVAFGVALPDQGDP